MAQTNEATMAGALDALAAVLAQQAELLANQNAQLADLKRSQPVRTIEFSDPEYQAALAKTRRVWKTRVYQNGYEVLDATDQTDETIERVSQLRSGFYLGKRVQVHIGPKADVWFFYKNATPDQRFGNQMDFSSFPDLVNKIWAEMQGAATTAA
jgi:hypothetical protein